MTVKTGKLVFRDVQRQFDRAAADFDYADFVHRKCFDSLVERLAPVSVKPARILDLGSATGTGSRQLARVYRKARVVSLDASANMLARSRAKRPIFSGIRELRADARHLPLQTGSIDLVFANLLLPWIDELPDCLLEVARVLAKGGVFAFSTLGAGSLAALREAWQTIDGFPHVREFADMHDLGDALVRAGLADPILDVDVLNVTYRNIDRLMSDIRCTASRNCLAGRRPSLTGKSRFSELGKALAVNGNEPMLSLQLELVFGHAWGSGPRLPDGEFHLAPAAISRRQRH
jgi:malonyl-CoA O-methyltransferase